MQYIVTSIFSVFSLWDEVLIFLHYSKLTRGKLKKKKESELALSATENLYHVHNNSDFVCNYQ